MFGCSFFLIKTIAVWLPESRQAVTRMLPWLPYVHCTKPSPSSGWLELNGEKSCPLESSADPFSCPAALCSGVLRLLCNCGRSRTAARRHAVPAGTHPTAPFAPKIGVWETVLWKQGRSKGCLLESGFGLVCSGLVQGAEFLLTSLNKKTWNGTWKRTIWGP